MGIFSKKTEEEKAAKAEKKTAKAIVKADKKRDKADKKYQEALDKYQEAVNSGDATKIAKAQKKLVEARENSAKAIETYGNVVMDNFEKNPNSLAVRSAIDKEIKKNGGLSADDEEVSLPQPLRAQRRTQTRSVDGSDVDVVGELKINADGTTSYQAYDTPQKMPSGGVRASEQSGSTLAGAADALQGTDMSDGVTTAPAQTVQATQQGSSQQQTGDVDAYGNPVDNSSSNASSDSEDENASQADNSQSNSNSNSNSTGDPLIDLFVSLIRMEMEFRQQRFEYALDMREAHRELMRTYDHDYGLEQPDLALSAREDDKKEPLNPALFAAMRERD